MSISSTHSSSQVSAIQIHRTVDSKEGGLLQLIHGPGKCDGDCVHECICWWREFLQSFSRKGLGEEDRAPREGLRSGRSIAGQKDLQPYRAAQSEKKFASQGDILHPRMLSADPKIIRWCVLGIRWFGFAKCIPALSTSIGGFIHFSYARRDPFWGVFCALPCVSTRLWSTRLWSTGAG